MPADQLPSCAFPKGSLCSDGGGTFALRRQDIYNRLKECIEKCIRKYKGRKELASERDETVADLLDALEDGLTYGLTQTATASIGLTAAHLIQNMQEIMTGSSRCSDNEVTMWDFIQVYLTTDERQRIVNLRHVWTKTGYGRAFLRSALNEGSLARYFIIWLADEDKLRHFYSPWSLLLDAKAASGLLMDLVDLRASVLFAINADCTMLNVGPRDLLEFGRASTQREEPIIHAPSPVPVVNRCTRRAERPIATANSTEDLLKEVQLAGLRLATGAVEFPTEPFETRVEQVAPPPPCDPIGPELEFLKQPLPDFTPEIHMEEESSPSGQSKAITNGRLSPSTSSETSSQCSKSSSAAGGFNCFTSNSFGPCAHLERLRESEERCSLLETRVAQLTRDNRQLIRRLTQHFKESGIDPSSSLTTNFLITIPTVKLLKSKTHSSYYVYEIHITMKHNLEHWFVLRRYREFYKLHQSLLRTHPTLVAALHFPPKKHFGNMNLVFVEERRQQLQIYLLNLVETMPQVEACKTKAELQKVFPFFRER